MRTKAYGIGFTLAVVAVAAVLVAIHAAAPVRAAYIPPDGDIRVFLELVDRGAYDQAAKRFGDPDFEFRPDPYPPATESGMPLAEAEAKGLLKGAPSSGPTQEKQVHLLSVIRRFVVEQFGEKAWSNASYELESVVEPGEAMNRIEQFWTEIGNREGVNLLDMQKPPAPNESEADWAARVMKAKPIMDQYVAQVPVKQQTNSRSKTFYVRLSFGHASRDGHSDFRFLISNQHGKWTIRDFGFNRRPPTPDEQRTFEV